MNSQQLLEKATRLYEMLEDSRKESESIKESIKNSSHRVTYEVLKDWEDQVEELNHKQKMLLKSYERIISKIIEHREKLKAEIEAEISKFHF